MKEKKKRKGRKEGKKRKEEKNRAIETRKTFHPEQHFNYFFGENKLIKNLNWTFSKTFFHFVSYLPTSHL